MQENYVAVADKVKLWTCVSGEQHNTAIMLCSGGPGSADYLEPVADMLDDVAKVIRFEQRACGRSTEDYQCDVDTTIADLEAVRQFYDVPNWIIAGHSWGANLALAYALKHPESCLALLYMSGNGVQNDRMWSEEYHKNRSEFGELMPESTYPANKEVNRLGNLSWRNFIQNPQLLVNIARLKVPSLFLYGSKDVRPSWPAEQVSNLLPDSMWVMVQGATHYTWLTHAHETREQLRKFVISFTGESMRNLWI